MNGLGFCYFDNKNMAIYLLPAVSGNFKIKKSSWKSLNPYIYMKVEPKIIKKVFLYIKSTSEIIISVSKCMFVPRSWFLCADRWCCCLASRKRYAAITLATLYLYPTAKTLRGSQKWNIAITYLFQNKSWLTALKMTFTIKSCKNLPLIL